MIKLLLKPEKTTKKLLSVLPERSYDVLVRRFGLENNPQKTTLEAIGRDYGITRERVRQIENNAIKNIKKSDVFEKEKTIFVELENIIDQMGGVISEDDLLNSLHNNERTKNHIYFLLVLGDPFIKEKENNNFKTRWYIDKIFSEAVHNALDQINNQLSLDDLLSEEEIISLFLKHINNIQNKHKNNETIRRWLSISKNINRNHFNEWGLSASNNISVKGIRDYAYLSIRQHGSPLHFTEVAKSIVKNFGRQVHTATCHNELIKDPRFVLVGRGLYALSEWGYTGGVVKDVIKNILMENGPLNKDDIIAKVLKERYIKENTVAVNLQDSNTFKRDSKGRYILA